MGPTAIFEPSWSVGRDKGKLELTGQLYFDHLP